MKSNKEHCWVCVGENFFFSVFLISQNVFITADNVLKQCD